MKSSFPITNDTLPDPLPYSLVCSYICFSLCFFFALSFLNLTSKLQFLSFFKFTILMLQFSFSSTSHSSLVLYKANSWWWGWKSFVNLIVVVFVNKQLLWILRTRKHCPFMWWSNQHHRCHLISFPINFQFFMYTHPIKETEYSILSTLSFSSSLSEVGWGERLL